MSDSVIKTQTVTNPPTTDLDAEDLVGAGPSGEDIFRERVQVTGKLLAEIARVLNVEPTGTEYGLVTRPIETKNQVSVIDLLQQILVKLTAIEIHLSLITDENIEPELETKT